MKQLHLKALAFAAIVAVTACSGGQSAGSVVPSTPGESPAQTPIQMPAEAPAAYDNVAQDLTDENLTPENGYYPETRPDAARPLCPASTARRVGEMRCFGWLRTDLVAIPRGDAIPAGIGYGPSDIASAYNLDPTQGTGQTVAIVDAYGYTKAASDLATYRSAAGLPACTTSNGCLRIVNQSGGAKLPKQPSKSSLNFGWVFEQSLDLDAVSAACPNCHIILFQAANTSSALFTAVSTAMAMTPIVSMSFGGSEFADPGLPASGFALIASAGDSGGGTKGGGPQSPCAWATIICVGGTRLTHKGSSWSSVVWNDESHNACGGPCGATGSGCSKVTAKPSWQTDHGCTKRSEADISAVASVYTPLAVYNSNLPSPHWGGIGGTSLSAPLIAGMIGLAGNATSLHAAQGIWQSHSSITDVTKGTNVYKAVTGACASKVRYICIAGVGYDGPTGWGSPNGTTDL